MKKKKSKIPVSVKLFFITFLVFLFLLLLLMSSIWQFIKDYTDISSKIWVSWSAGISLAVSIIVAFSVLHSVKKIGKSKFSIWLGRNWYKLLLGYFMIIASTVSFKNQSAWSPEEIQNVLSLQWTIFGISLTIFLAWNVIIVDFFKNRQPKQISSDDLLQKSKLVMEKDSFSQEVETAFSTTILITTNLFLLLISTASIYMISESNNLLNENILRFSFFFTSNSISCLFLDILKPLTKEKETLLKDNNVTKNDIDQAQTVIAIQAIFDGLSESIMSLDPNKYTKEEKEKMRSEYYKAIADALCGKTNNNSQENINKSKKRRKKRHAKTSKP